MAVTPGMPPLFALLAAIAGFAASAAGGSMLALSSAAYDPQVRSTGVGWALGVGRIGTVLGPIAIGILLGMGNRAGRRFRHSRRDRPAGGRDLILLVRVRANPIKKETDGGIQIDLHRTEPDQP
jgi:MFS family permease